MAQRALGPSGLRVIDWSRWQSWRVDEVVKLRRDPLLESSNYVENFEDLTLGIKKVTTKVPVQIEPGVDALFVATRRRLWDTFDLMSMQYSAGAPLEQMQEMWPYAMRWAEEYAMFHEAHHLDPSNHGGIVPHTALRTEDYWIVALRLLCFGMLTGHVGELTRVMKFVDYGNELMNVRDGLIERLVAPFLPDRGTPPDTATRHLPYRKLFKVYAAAADKRPALMQAYLEEWYEASRREPYVDQHLEGGFTHFGYWSWEAAATTWLLDIDDSSYRDMNFYPCELIEFARSLPRPEQLGRSSTEPRVASARLRCEAGQPCPQQGWWSTPAKAHSRRAFKAGEQMPEIIDSPWGSTIWYWDDRQD